ncbi:hypothetical protein AOB60_00270 [Streptomyces noursei]|uniref:Uncharacterized protein n=2 Tax=Streptomyces noursei TaxID=1971 RepID=A0A2N8PQV7_STRNR|nr:hypothetical protein AOB60_00270 [Streptomyces noursei]
MAPEAAALLGFGSAESFRTSMEKGNLPEFKERHLPEGSWEGDSDRLVLAPEAAALLGFSSTDGFLTRLSLGDFPELRDPARAVGEYGLVHKAWPLSAVRGVARRLGTDLERVRTQDGRLLRAWPLELVARVARRRGQYPVAADDVLGSLPL